MTPPREHGDDAVTSPREREALPAVAVSDPRRTGTAGWLMLLAGLLAFLSGYLTWVGKTYLLTHARGRSADDLRRLTRGVQGVDTPYGHWILLFAALLVVMGLLWALGPLHRPGWVPVVGLGASLGMATTCVLALLRAGSWLERNWPEDAVVDYGTARELVAIGPGSGEWVGLAAAAMGAAGAAHALVSRRRDGRLAPEALDPSAPE